MNASNHTLLINFGGGWGRGGGTESKGGRQTGCSDTSFPRPSTSIPIALAHHQMKAVVFVVSQSSNSNSLLPIFTVRPKSAWVVGRQGCWRQGWRLV